mmetsp:Transcript_18487/g.27404  ORF Transcript_18487/g.27404 Transcript_18487/m.27404 type:complete len:125 (-) Transcript_18487:802-1176(-)
MVKLQLNQSVPFSGMWRRTKEFETKAKTTIETRNLKNKLKEYPYSQSVFSSISLYSFINNVILILFIVLCNNRVSQFYSKGSTSLRNSSAMNGDSDNALFLRGLGVKIIFVPSMSSKNSLILTL